MRKWLGLGVVTVIVASAFAMTALPGSARATLPCCGGAGTHTNYSAVVSYALQWVGSNLGTNSSVGYNNVNYTPQNDDCTNFVSQALHAGGWTNDFAGHSIYDPSNQTNLAEWFHTTGPSPDYAQLFSVTWVNVADLITYSYNTGRGIFLNSGATYQNANWADVVPGDILMVNWDPQNGSSIDHSMIVTSTGGVPFGQVKLSDIKITQHTTNRKNYALTNDTGATGQYPASKWWIMEPY